MPIQTLLDAALDAVIVTDRTGKIVSVNPRPGALFPIEPRELVGRPIESLIPERFRERHAAPRGTHASSTASRPLAPRVNVTGRRRDGSEFKFDVELTPVPAGPDTLLCGIIREPTVPPTADAANVLLVTDDSAVSEATSMLLRVAGYHVTRVKTASDALAAMASERPPDVVVCDIYQSDAEAGAEAVAWLRARTGTTIPALVIAYGAPPEAAEPQRACRFLIQSAYANELIGEIERLLDA